MGRTEGRPWVSTHNVWNCSYMWMDNRTPPPTPQGSRMFPGEPWHEETMEGVGNLSREEVILLQKAAEKCEAQVKRGRLEPSHPLRGSGVGPPKQETWMPLPASAQPSPSQPTSPAPEPDPSSCLAPNLGSAVHSLKNLSSTSSQHAVRG